MPKYRVYTKVVEWRDFDIEPTEADCGWLPEEIACDADCNADGPADNSQVNERYAVLIPDGLTEPADHYAHVGN